MTPVRFPRGALFDLDGTLLDSAPDMLATVNRMRATRGLGALPLAAIRPYVSRGARAMSTAAFGAGGMPVDADVVSEFLAVYAEELGRHSLLFEGVADMLAALEADGVRWGVVTNKPEHLAARIIPQLGWSSRCAVLVGGDTLVERKPHPLPLLHAAAAIGLAPSQCVYVGDDLRDIQAAQAAGMPSVAALWGYRLDEDDPAAWNADAMVAAARDLCDPARWPEAG
ncbi:MAG TPA: phosphoglycolate phosphatase [Luteimonas sp.]|nr:phosphoglycolate phosphatase [Luteimonas sp.]